jgi:hypothetical protein
MQLFSVPIPLKKFPRILSRIAVGGLPLLPAVIAALPYILSMSLYKNNAVLIVADTTLGRPRSARQFS